MEEHFRNRIDTIHLGLPEVIVDHLGIVTVKLDETFIFGGILLPYRSLNKPSSDNVNFKKK
jgi:hypothetical protein